MVLACQIYEQAAKECGDAYTNKRQLSGPNNGPLKVRTLADFYGGMTAQQAADLYAESLRENGPP